MSDKMKDKIADIIYSSLDYAYCNNCKFDINSDEDICDYCNRKSINWELSESKAQNIASKIIEELKM